MKQDWKKQEKNLYLPKNKPEKIFIPAMNYFSVSGQGNPNNPEFGDYISVLYGLSYAIKMSPKKGMAPADYFEYTVYPLEGVWDISDEGKKNYKGVIDKNTLVFNLMIRQPDFVTKDYAFEIIDLVKNKKPHRLLDQVKFETIEEGHCIQMLHTGSYDNEPQSFKEMELFAESLNLKRKSMLHREIYLSDARKVVPEKLKTVLRFGVE